MKAAIVCWSRRIANHLTATTAQKLDAIGRLMSYVHGFLPQVAVQRPGVVWHPNFQALVVLPEYFLTRPRPSLAHAKALDEADKDAALATLLGWSQWCPEQLVVPGTVAFRKSFDRPAGKQHRADGTVKPAAGRSLKASVNLAGAPAIPPMMQSYPWVNSPPAVSPGTAQKQAQLAALDMMHSALGTPAYIYKNQAYVIQNGQVRYKYNKRRDFFETFGAPHEVHAPDVNAAATQHIHGILFGFEICFDHNQGALAADVAYGNQLAGALLQHGYAPAMPAAPDIHVLVSASVGNAASPVRDGGLFVHASTDDAQTTVRRRRGGAMLPAEANTLELIGDVQFLGDRLRVWLADV